jgi:hypothetical protein
MSTGTKFNLPKAKTKKDKPKKPKMIKPPVPAKPFKPRPKPRTTNSRTGAVGSTSPY